MKWGMFVVERIDGVPIGEWLASYDIEAEDPQRFPGGGTYTFTSDQAKALAFNDVADVFELWKRQAVRVPLRQDGKPNRPFTQFTIQPRKLE